jgi:pimeloyl-ACP methyl ester carboxylesterase
LFIAFTRGKNFVIVQSTHGGKKVPEPQHTIESVAGCNISLMRAGIGAPLLFLHGARGSSQWLPFMDALAANFEVFVPEHPGFGKSETPPWLDNIADLAYFYLDFIDKLGLSGVHLVGTSLGGWIAAELAIRNETSLSTLTLVAAAGLHVKDVAKGDIFMWSAAELARNLFYDQKYSEWMLLATPSDAEQDMQLKNRLTTAKLGWQPRLYDPHLAKWLHRITVPTLIVWGANDKLVPTPYASAFGDAIPGARVQIFDNCGHLPQIEKSQEFVAAVTAFLQGARR